MRPRKASPILNKNRKASKPTPIERPFFLKKSYIGVMIVSNTHNKIGENSYDVSLTIKAEASDGEKTMFIAEVEQSGVFVMNGYDDQEIKDLIAVYCPSTLFPYVREMLSSMVAKGGFPALNLQPISFEALYAQAKEEQDQQTKN